MPTNKKNTQSFVQKIEPKLSIPVIIIVAIWTAGMTYAMSFIKTDTTPVDVQDNDYVVEESIVDEGNPMRETNTSESELPKLETEN